MNKHTNKHTVYGVQLLMACHLPTNPRGSQTILREKANEKKKYHEVNRRNMSVASLTASLKPDR